MKRNALKILYGHDRCYNNTFLSHAILTLTLAWMLSSSPAGAHFRGPHHPKNTPLTSSSSGQGHTHQHYVPRGTPGGEPAPILTHDKNLLHDKEHLKEDMGDWILADGKDLSPEEMEFHYFKVHDFDNNSMLDGLEILQALSHILPMTEVDANESIDLTGRKSSMGAVTEDKPTHKTMTREEAIKQREDDFNYYIDLIDKVLEEDDMNKDGYLSYFEYVVGRRSDEKKEKALHSSDPGHTG